MNGYIQWLSIYYIYPSSSQSTGSCACWSSLPVNLDLLLLYLLTHSIVLEAHLFRSTTIPNAVQWQLNLLILNRLEMWRPVIVDTSMGQLAVPFIFRMILIAHRCVCNAMYKLIHFANKIINLGQLTFCLPPFARVHSKCSHLLWHWSPFFSYHSSNSLSQDQDVSAPTTPPD